MKAKPYTKPNSEVIEGYSIFCPGCGYTHDIQTNPTTAEPKALWTFNGSLDKPTFNPSLLIRTGRFTGRAYEEDPDLPSVICHSFITNGKIDYLRDSTHHLSGQTIELTDL